MKEFPLVNILNFLEREDNFVFLETARQDQENYLSYLFLRPQRIISTCNIDQVQDCFRKLNAALKQGYYAAGFLAYEAGEAFEEILKTKAIFDFPLLWLGIYKQPLIYNHRQQKFVTKSSSGLIKKIITSHAIRQKDYCLNNIRPNITEQSYLKAIAKIKALIAQGFTYQVNYTFKLNFSFSGSASSLYLNLRNNQHVPYSALIKAGRWDVLSCSPELFFKKSGQKIWVRPMKGTAKRGRDLTEDGIICRQLSACPKNRSENLMIVDLLRNDLGRISHTGSVRVPRLFRVEKYETLFQMTSDVQSRLSRRNFGFDIFRHIFPSGSVTGAPKLKTMQIIRKLERSARNIYTGSIGFFAPQKQAAFNVAIRTVLIDRQTQKGQMGVGSGIVYDSDPKKEFAECLLKANFLLKSPPKFALIETMLWQAAQGWLLLNAHLARLKRSAQYFNFPYDRQQVRAALKKLEPKLTGGSYRVRLTLDQSGKLRLEHRPVIKIIGQLPKVCFAAQKTHSANPFLYHKTTNRKSYNEEHRRCQRLGFYDAIFSNERNEITEGAISNILIRKNGRWFTTPVSSGLLDGVYRRHLLRSKKLKLQEKVLFKKDLLSAQEIYLTNSVRKLVQVSLEAKNH